MQYHYNERNFPIIDLGDYVLREQTAADVEDFFRYYSDPEVNKYIVSDIPDTVEEAQRELQYWINIFNCDDGIYFGIVRKDNNQLIGSIGLSSINRNHNRIEISYDLAKEYWNKGIMTKAMIEVVRYGFDIMGINRIEAFALPANGASRAVLEKCGFTLEGNLRQHRRHNGVYKDIDIFSILFSEYKLSPIYK